MRATRFVSFLLLVGSFIFFVYSASPRALGEEGCNPPGYGYGYAWISDSGTCDGINDMNCWGACTDCFSTEDQGSIAGCDEYPYSGGGTFYIAYCDCHII